MFKKFFARGKSTQNPTTRFALSAATLAVVALLAACGGGGNGGQDGSLQVTLPLPVACLPTQVTSSLNGETRCKNSPTDATYVANTVWANWVRQPVSSTTIVKSLPAVARNIPSASLDQEVHVGTSIDFAYSSVIHNDRPTLYAIFQTDGAFYIKLLYADKREAPFGSISMLAGAGADSLPVVAYWVYADRIVHKNSKEVCYARAYNAALKAETSDQVICPTK